MNEQKAIRLCLKDRDPIGFEYLVQKYREKAFYHAISWLNSREDALDACQESFTRAFGAITRVRELKRFYPWFYVILRNCCMNILVGGEIMEYTKLMAESREQAIDRMNQEAERMGANAVVGLRFTTSMIMGGAAELLSYGTAVYVEEE
jgi:DNA-directed RNA polymerase specialized sigma24 family protein